MDSSAAYAQDKCHFCNKEKFKYTCPKCNKSYCSVQCYKSPLHLKCSEAFYRDCIQEELLTAKPQSSEEMGKIYDILKRMHAADAGMPTDFADDLDSDDDELPGRPEGSGAETTEEVDEEDLVTRLQGVDVNDANGVWQRLTTTEREEFQKLVESGEIMKLLPNHKPWWAQKHNKANAKIVELPTKEDAAAALNALPTIAKDIPKFTDICKKTPSPCLHYNLWNILAAYGCTVRFFNGEQLTNPGDAAAHLMNLCATLKYGTNFEDVEDALNSVKTEALTTGNSGAADATSTFVESREQLKTDTRQLMLTQEYTLAALSDLLQIFQLAKQKAKHAKSKEAQMQKLFAMCAGSVELTPNKLKELIRKIEFFLAYVNRDQDSELA